MFIIPERKTVPKVIGMEYNLTIFSFDPKIVPDGKTFRRLMRDRSPMMAMSYAYLLRSIASTQHNKITDFGLNQAGNLLNGESALYWRYNGVGSGTNTAAAGDTDLQTAIGARVEVTDPYTLSNVCHEDTFYTSTMNNGTWNEVILATASTGANACARAILAAPFAMDGSKSAVVAWEITITSVF